jgi:membrane protease YdiL (CAAX protease family)
MKRLISHPAFAFALYGAVLTLWVLRLIFLTPFQSHLNGPWLWYSNIRLKWAFFVLPALGFVSRSSVQKPLNGLLMGFSLGLAYFGARFLLKLLMGHPQIDVSPLSQLLAHALGAPVAEELLFRGALLPMLARHHPFWRANLIASVMFVGIHYPGWIMFGWSFIHIVQDTLGVMFVGLVTGWLWQRTGALWASMAFHLSWNLSVEMLLAA